MYLFQVSCKAKKFGIYFISLSRESINQTKFVDITISDGAPASPTAMSTSETCETMKPKLEVVAEESLFLSNKGQLITDGDDNGIGLMIDDDYDEDEDENEENGATIMEIDSVSVGGGGGVSDDENDEGGDKIGL